MAFQKSSVNIKLDRTFLTAWCEDSRGVGQDAFLDLNEFIGNNEGSLQWGWTSFGDSSSNIQLVFWEDAVVLTAECKKTGGESQHAMINLSERIANQNGQLVVSSAV